MPAKSSRKAASRVLETESDYSRYGITYDDLKRSIEQASEDRMWFYKNLDRIRKKHLKKWVAVRGKRIVDSNEDHDTLMTRLKAHPEELRFTDILFVYPKGTLRIV